MKKIAFYSCAAVLALATGVANSMPSNSTCTGNWGDFHLEIQEGDSAPVEGPYTVFQYMCTPFGWVFTASWLAGVDSNGLFY